MPSLLSRLFVRSGRGRPATPRRAVYLGGEVLEPRVALAVTTGSVQLRGTFVIPDPKVLETATSFTINNYRTISSSLPQAGYFQGMPVQNFGNTSFVTTDGSSLSFTTTVFGEFRSISITQTRLDITPVVNGFQVFRDFKVFGTFVGGTYGGPVTPSPAPAEVTMTLNQTVTNGVPGAISGSQTMSIMESSPDFLVAADDLGCTSTPRVYVINPDTGDIVSDFVAYEASYRGGVRVAIGDVDGDLTTLEVVTAPGPGRVGEIRVFRTNGDELPGFRLTPFGSRYRRGLELGVGDLDGDGRFADLVVSESRGLGRVVAYTSNGSAFTPWKSFTAFSGRYTGGASVAVAGVNRVAVGSGVGMKPTVKVYDLAAAAPALVSQFAPPLPTGTGGVSVTAQRFTSLTTTDVAVAGGANARSAIGVYPATGGAAARTYSTFASRPKPNVPVFAAPAALVGGLVDTVFQSQGTGGVGGILKVNATTGAIDPAFAPVYNGKLLAGPLRIATRAVR